MRGPDCHPSPWVRTVGQWVLDGGRGCSREVRPTGRVGVRKQVKTGTTTRWPLPYGGGEGRIDLGGLRSFWSSSGRGETRRSTNEGPPRFRRRRMDLSDPENRKGHHAGCGGGHDPSCLSVRSRKDSPEGGVRGVL